MYTIDLATLLELLQEFRKSGILHAELPPGTAGIRESCRAWIELLSGEVTSCHVKNVRGQTLSAGDEALLLLKRAGTLEWELTAQVEETRIPTGKLPQVLPILPTPPSLPMYPQPGTEIAAIPRRVVHVNQHALNSWPRLYRRVYVLVDGRNSVQRIAVMLALYPQGLEQVRQALAELEVMGMITLRRPS